MTFLAGMLAGATLVLAYGAWALAHASRRR